MLCGRAHCSWNGHVSVQVCRSRETHGTAEGQGKAERGCSPCTSQGPWIFPRMDVGTLIVANTLQKEKKGGLRNPHWTGLVLLLSEPCGRTGGHFPGKMHSHLHPICRSSCHRYFRVTKLLPPFLAPLLPAGQVKACCPELSFLAI